MDCNNVTFKIKYKDFLGEYYKKLFTWLLGNYSETATFSVLDTNSAVNTGSFIESKDTLLRVPYMKRVTGSVNYAIVTINKNNSYEEVVVPWDKGEAIFSGYCADLTPFLSFELLETLNTAYQKAVEDGTDKPVREVWEKSK